MVEEFSDLQAEVSLLGKEKEVLLKTIDNLNHEIKEMNAKVLLAEPEKVSEDLGASDVGISHIKEEFVEPPRIHIETGDGDKSIEKGDILDQCAEQPSIRYPMDVQNNWNDSTVNELNNVYVNDKVNSKMGKSKMRQEENEESNLAICNAVELQDIKTSKKQKLPNKRYSLKGDTKLKCEQCPFETSWKQALNRHKKAVHDRIRNHVCGECGYSSSEMGTLRHHVEGVHEKIRKHVCEECGFAATQKSNLKSHKRSVHSLGSKKTDKKFQCRECSYITNRIDAFRRHRGSVHKLRISGDATISQKNRCQVEFLAKKTCSL